ncbi:GAF domain-containing protein, partial [candidate division KSB1 bacterium]|nr:GAF domain-containing protein [candidate division KSB1 bacterium]
MVIVYWGSAHTEQIRSTVDRIDQYTLTIPNDVKTLDQNITDSAILIVDQERADNPLFGAFSARLVLLDGKKEPDGGFDDKTLYLRLPAPSWEIAQALQRLEQQLSYRAEIERLNRTLGLHSREMTELNKIGIALSAERDPDILLEMILGKTREITMADAGSLYLIEKNPDVEADESDYWADKQLRFKLAHNDSIDASYKEFVMPVKNSSMAGYTAITGKPLNIPDAYSLPADSQIQHNKSFDQKMGYRTQSVLCLPMKNHRGEMIGVLQLINRKTHAPIKLQDPKGFQQHVLPFDERCVEMASSLASQAAVSIENMKLYEEIKGLFEGFIVASVHAIEQRDPTTFGHSQRVAELSVGLAAQIDRINSGRFGDVRFSRDDLQQIKYAGLLHDFGKIGVRENVLVKAKKLYPEQIDLIKFRFQFIRQSIELQNSRTKVQYLLDKNRDKIAQEFEALDRQLLEKLEDVDRYLQFVLEANEPRLLDGDAFERLTELRNLTYRDNGSINPFITDDEFKFLS